MSTTQDQMPRQTAAGRACECRSSAEERRCRFGPSKLVCYESAGLKGGEGVYLVLKVKL